MQQLVLVKMDVSTTSGAANGTAPWEDTRNASRFEKRPGRCSVLRCTEGKEGQKPPCTLPLAVTCHQRRPSPSQGCRYQDSCYILHLPTSRIFFSSFSFHLSSPFTRYFMFLLQIPTPFWNITLLLISLCLSHYNIISPAPVLPVLIWFFFLIPLFFWNIPEFDFCHYERE